MVTEGSEEDPNPFSIHVNHTSVTIAPTVHLSPQHFRTPPCHHTSSIPFVFHTQHVTHHPNTIQPHHQIQRLCRSNYLFHILNFGLSFLAAMLVYQSQHDAPVLIKHVFDILVSLQFNHQTLCRSQTLALGIFLPALCRT